mmetsp:Transcript_35203/g.64297  ORF Transcript_35203/g.64297 Transcript_35203/m.64297 type:complete len:335 (-) Transcript_35203:80-1084(-)
MFLSNLRSEARSSNVIMEQVDNEISRQRPRQVIFQSLLIILAMSRHSLAAFSIVFSLASFVYMFSITLAMMAVGGELDLLMFGVLLTAHLLALASALVRMVSTTMHADDRPLEVWQCSIATGSLVVDMIQGAYLIVTWKADWMHRAFMISLSFILLLDMSEVFSAHGMFARERARRAWLDRPKPKIQVERFKLKKNDVEAGIGKSAYAERPCHVCLEELQEGDDVGKLLCGHTFHAGCIERWLESGTGCPLRCPEAFGPSAVAEAEPASEAEPEPAGGRAPAADFETSRIGLTVPGTPTSQEGQEAAVVQIPASEPPALDVDILQAADRVVMEL